MSMLVLAAAGSVRGDKRNQDMVDELMDASSVEDGMQDKSPAALH